MKYFYVFFLFFFLSFSCTNDKSESLPVELPEQVAELEKLLDSSSEAEHKVQILDKLYKKFYKTDSRRSLQYLRQQASLASALENFLQAGKACYNAGLINANLGNYISAVEWYLKSIHYFEQSTEENRIARALSNLGVVFMETGSFEYAIKFFEKARNTYLNQNDQAALVRTSLNLGICHFSKMRPDYASAKIFLQEALEFNSQNNVKPKYYQNRIYNNIGAMYYAQGNFDEARSSYLHSLEFIHDNEDLDQLRFIAYNNIAETEIGRRNYTDAKSWILKVEALLASNDFNSRSLVNSYNIMGKLCQHEGNDKKATDYFEIAITVSNKEVLNNSLQETLSLLRVSYRNLENSVSREKYDTILKIDALQDQLERELAESTNFNALNAALSKTIELDTLKRSNEVVTAQIQATTYVSIVLVVLFLVTSVVSFFYGKKYLASGRTNMKWHRELIEIESIITDKRPLNVILREKKRGYSQS